MGFDFVDTTVGPIGASEVQLLTWLSWRRWHKGLPTEGALVNAFKNFSCQTRSGEDVGGVLGGKGVGSNRLAF